MKRKTCLSPIALVFATIALVGPADAQNEAVLVGRWRSAETSHGGIGAMCQFKADGTMQFSPGAVVDMPYRLEGDQLILPPATTNGPEQKSTITWTGQELFRMSAEGQDGGTYRRVGAPIDPQHPLLGEWLGSRQMNGTTLETRMIFGASGSCLLLIKFSTQQGTYSAKGGKLTVRINGEIALDGTFTVANRELTILRADGKVTKLKSY